MEKDKNLYDELRQSNTFNEALKNESIDSALGQDTANIESTPTPQSNLDILNNNQPIVNQTPNEDGIGLEDNEREALDAGFQDFQLGVNHTSQEEIDNFRKTNAYARGRGVTEDMSGSAAQEGSRNVTAELAEDFESNEESDIASGYVYREMLGDTAFADLKAACGLSKNDSFTDFYNRTHYTPKGYELDVKLALAEERRMKEFMRYKNKEISYNKFLYNAYGKDLLLEQGYDLSSKLFWYNKFKNNDFTNPLDSTTFLSDLLKNAEAMFKADSWYRDSSAKELTSMMSGLSTGTMLSADEFKKVFSNQVKNLAPYFDNDIKKIMNYYRAGYLSSAFSPFIDVNGDGKFDYYYHNDGKLYAVDNDDSVGTGKAKATLVYNDDGSVHSAQVHEGIDGWVDSLWDGFSQFFAGIADIGALAVNGVSAIFGCSFADKTAEWEAWKKEWLMDEDRIVFDSMSQWNGEDWGNAIAEAGGYIAGMVALIIATWGIGAAVSGATSATEAGVAAGQQGLQVAGEKATEESIKAGIAKGVETLNAKLIAKELTQKQFNVAMNSMMRTFLKEGAKQGVTKALLNTAGSGVAAAASSAAGQTIGKLGAVSASKMAARGSAQMAINNIANALVGQGVTNAAGKRIGESLLTTVGKARGGTAISSFLSLTAKEGTKWAAVTSNAWFRAGVNATELAIRDVLQMTSQLQAQNRTLAYMQDNVKDENGNPVYHQLSNEEIFGRVAAVAGTDMIISTLFRATGDQGFSSRFVVNTSNIDRALDKASDSFKQTLNNYLTHMRAWSVADSVLDVFENISTASVQAMMSNPYAQNAEAMGKTFIQSAINPKTVAMNLYALSNDLFTFGHHRDGSAFNTSIYDDRMTALLTSIKTNGKALGDLIGNIDIALSKSKRFDATDLHESLLKFKTEITKEISSDKGNVAENYYNAAVKVSQLFTDDVVEREADAFAEAYGMSKDEFNNLRTIIKEYNSSVTDENEKLNFITGKIFYDAQKANDKYVAEVYTMILNHASEVSTQRMKAFNNWMSKGGITSKLFGKDGLAYAGAVQKLMTGIGSKVVNDFTGSLQGINKTFVESRFESIRSSLKLDGTPDEYQESVEQVRSKLRELLEKDFIKTGSFSENNVNANIKYSWKLDPKTGKYEYVGEATDVLDILTKMFLNPEKNGDAIKAFAEAGFFTREDDGKTLTAGGAPFFYFTIPSDKRNDFLKAANEDDEVANLFRILDLMCVAGKDGIFDSYNIPTLIKVKVAVEDSNNPNAMQDVYVIGNNFGAGLTESANRLQTVEATLYTIYRLYLHSEGSKPEFKLSQEELQKYMAQLGSLLCEEATQDPYYDFLKEWNEKKVEGFEAQIKLATAYALRGASMTDDDAIFNRQRLLELYRAGAISKSTLKELESHALVGKTAKLLNDYIEFSVEEDNKIKTALGALVALQDDPSNGEKKDIVLSLIKEINAPENKELLEILRKDKKIYGALDELITRNITDPEGFANFWNELQSTTHLGAQTRLLSGLSESELGKIRDSVLNSFLKPETVKIISERTNRTAIVKQTLNRVFVDEIDVADDLLTKLFGRDLSQPIETIGFFNSMTDEDVRKFLTDPLGTIDYYVRNYKYNDGNGISEKRAELMEKISNKIKNRFLSDKGEFLYEKLFNEVMDVMTDGTGSIQGNRDAIVNLIEIPLGIKFDGRKLSYNNKLGGWTYEGQLIGKRVLTSEITKKLIDKSLMPEAREIAKDIISKSLDFYYKDTVSTDSLDIVTLNILDILPDNLYRGIKSLATSKALSKSADLSARIQGEEIGKLFENLLKTNGSTTMAQYNAYYKMLDLALKTNSFIFTYNVNDETQMNSLRRFLTSIGYDNALRDLEDETISIPGLYFKKIKTHNINTTLNYQKLYNYAMAKAMNNSHTVTIEKAEKDIIPVLFNMFDSLNYVKGTDSVSLTSFTSPEDYEITYKTVKGNGDVRKHRVTIDRSKAKEAIVFGDIIYKKIGDKFVIGKTISDEELDRAIKGTLEGGSNLEKYIIRNRFLDIDPTEGKNLEDTKSSNTSFVLQAIDRVWDYLYKFKGNEATAFEVSVPNSMVKDFETMYSDPNSIYTYTKVREGVYKLLAKPTPDKKAFVNHVLTNGFNLKQILPIWNPIEVENIKVIDANEFSDQSNETLFSVLYAMQHPFLKTVEDFKRELATTYDKDGLYKIDEDKYQDFCVKHDGESYNQILKALESEDTENDYYFALLKYKLEKDLAISEFAKEGLSKNEQALLEIANPDLYRKVGAYINDHNLISSGYDPTDTDIDGLAKDVGVSFDAAKILVDTLKHTQEMLYRSLSEKNVLGKQDLLLSAISQFMHEGEAGATSFAVEFLAGATRKTQQEFMKFLSDASKDTTTFDTDEIKLLEYLYSAIDKKLQLLSQLNPSADDEDAIAGSLERLYALAGKNAPSVRIMIDNSFLNKTLNLMDQDTLDIILRAGVSRSLKKKHGSPFVKLSSQDLSNISTSDDYFTASLGQIINATVLRGINDKPGSIMIENMQRRDMIGRYMISVMANVADLEEGIKASGINMKSKMSRDMLTDLAIQMHTLTTGQDYQADYATSAILRFNDETGDYEIVPLALAIQDEDNSILGYLLGRKAISTDFELKDFSLDAIERIRSNEHEHVFLFKGSKNMFVDTLEGGNGRSAFVSLDSEENRLKIKEYAIKRFVKDVADGNFSIDGNNYDEREMYQMMKDGADFNSYIADYYNLKYTLPLQDLWYNFIKSYEGIGVAREVLPSIFNSVQSMYAGREIKTGNQLIDDVIERSTNTLKDTVDEYQYSIIMDTLKYGINSAALSNEDKINFKNYAYRMKAEADFETVGLDDGIIKRIIDNNTVEMEIVRDDISRLSDEEKIYCIKQILLNRMNGSDIFSVLNARNGKSLEDVIKSLSRTTKRGVDRDMVTDWKSKNKKYNLFNITKNTINATFDLEWLTMDNDNENNPYRDGLYQVAFAVRDPSNPSEIKKYNLLISSRLNSDAKQQGVYSSDQHQLRFTESEKSFKAKAALPVDNYREWSDDELIKHSQIVVDTPFESLMLADKILKKLNVSTLLGFNSFADGDNDVSDVKFFIDAGFDYRQTMDLIDIRKDALNKIYTHETEGLIGERMDDIREQTNILSTKVGEAHDASVDIDDEYKLFEFLINNATRTDKLYTNDLDNIADLFGRELFKKVNFNDINMSDSLNKIFSSIDIKNGKFVRGNQAFKKILDDYNAITFNHSFKRINTKALNRSIEDVTDVYFSTFNKAYGSVLKNYKARNNITNILLGLMNYNAGGKDIYSIIASGNYDDATNKVIAKSLLSSSAIISQAIQIYSSKARKSIDPEIQMASRDNLGKLFYTQKESDIKEQLAKAVCIIDSQGTMKRDEALRAFDTNPDIAKKYNDIVNNMFLKKGTDIDTKAFFESLRTNKEFDYDELQRNEAQLNFTNGVMNPIARMLGLQMDDDVSKSYESIDTDKVLSRVLTDETRKRLLHQLMMLKGTTADNKKNLETAKKLSTYNGRRIKLKQLVDKYAKDMYEELFSKDGMLSKHLVEASSLWSMGSGRRQFRSDGEEDTLYVGIDLLTSNKAYASLYGKYKVGSTFFASTWRQPLQQTTPLNVMKVVVVPGIEYSMTASTARKLHNGDFDGDYFYTQLIPEANSKVAEKLWEAQHVGGGILSNMFDKDFNYASINNRTQDDSTAAKKAFNKLSEDFKDLLNQDIGSFITRNGSEYDTYEKAYAFFEKRFIEEFLNEYQASSNKRLASTPNKNKIKSALQMLAAFGINKITLHDGDLLLTSNPFFDDVNIKNIINERNTRFMSNNQFDTGLAAPENGEAAKNYRGYKMTVPEDELHKMFFVPTPAIDKDVMSDLQAILASGHKLSATKMETYVDTLYSQGKINNDTLTFAKNFISEMVNAKPEVAVQYVQQLMQVLQRDMQYSDWYKETLKEIVPEMLGKLDKETYKKYQVVYKFMRDELGEAAELPELKEGSSGLDVLIAATTMAKMFFDERQVKDYIRFASSNDPFAFNIYADATFRNKQFGFSDVRDDTEVISADELVELNDSNKKAFGLAGCWVAVDNTDESGFDTLKITNRGKDGLSYTNVNKINLNSLSNRERERLATYIATLDSGKFITDRKIIRDIFGLENDDNTKYQLVGVVDRLNNPVDVRLNADLTDCTLVFTDTTSLYNLATKENVKLGFANAKAGKGSSLLFDGDAPRYDGITADLVMGKKLFDIKKLGNNLIGNPTKSADGRYTFYHVNNLAILNNLNFSAQNRDSSRYIDQIGLVQGSHGLGSLLAFSNLFIKRNVDGSYTFDPTAYSDLQKAIGYGSLERRFYDTNSASSVRLTRIVYLLSAIKDADRLNEFISKFSYNECDSIDSFANYLMNDRSLGGSRGAIIESAIWRTLTRDEQVKIDNDIASKHNMFGRVAFSKEVDDAMINPYASYFKFKNNPIVSKHGKPNDESVRTSKMRGASDNEDFLAQLEHSGHDLNEGNFVSTEAIVQMLLESQNRHYVKSQTKAAYENEVLDPVTGKLGNLYNGFHFMSDDQSLDLPDHPEETQSAKKAGNKRLYSERLKNLEAYDLFNIVPEESKFIKDDLYDPDNNIFDNMINDKNGTKAKALKSMLPFFGDGSDIQTKEAYNMFDFGFNQNLHKRYAAIDDNDRGTGFKVNTIRPEYERDQYGKVKIVNHVPQFKNYSFDQYKDFIKENSRNPHEMELLLEKKALFKKDFNNIDPKDAMNVLNIRIQEKAKSSAEIQSIISKWDTLKDEYESYESITPEFDMNKVNLIFNTERKYDENNVLGVARMYADDNSIKLVNSILNSYGYKAMANGEIALGTKTLNFQSNVGHNKEDLLGSEYNYILSLARVLPETYIQLNKYMEIEAALEAYAELTNKNDAMKIDNEKKYIKSIGKEKYFEYLEAAKAAFGNSTPEELRQMQLEMLKNNRALRSMVQAASKINKRLALEVSKVDPTGLIGWVLTSDVSTDDNSSWFKYRNVKLQKLYKNNFVESIHAIGRTIQSMSDPEAASLFFNNKTGYIGMIEDLSSRIAVTQASDKLGDYLKSNGWMKNLEVADEAMKIFQEKIAAYYDEASTAAEEGKSSKHYLENKKLFETWIFLLNDAGIDLYDKLPDTDLEYRNVGSLYQIFNIVSAEYNKLLANIKAVGMQEARDKVYALNVSSEMPEDKLKCDQMLKLLNAYENILSETIRTAAVNGKMNDIYSSINNAVLARAKAMGKVLVDKHGRHINKGDETVDYSSNHFYFDILSMLKSPDNPDDIPLYQAKEALLGNIYMMDESVAKQLERKVYSRRTHSKVKTYMRKAKNLATALVMTSPVQLLDRLVNFPLFDSGVVGSASGSTFKFMPEAMATVMKYINTFDNVDEKTLSNDPSMKKLLRFLAAANQNVFDNTVRGEQLKLSIPVLEQYTKLANLGYNAGNLIPRFAYYLNLLDSAEHNNMTIERNKTGVVWDKYDEINKIQAEDFLSKSGLYDEFCEDAKDYADIDSRIAYIISQHNGLEGNMPYGAQWLNENYNTMFLSFPMALMRWGKNRITSVGNALADAFNGNTNKGLQYLGSQLGSVLLTQALLLGLQMLLSKDTREYIGKKATNKDEELTEEEIKNAETILFRGGVVKPFQSLMQGEEVTSAHQSRGPAAGLFDSYIADFTNKFGDSDKSIGEKIKDFVMQHTWAHTNFLPKDIIESIPGNNFLQSTSWYNDSGNWFENYGRKILGYSMGSTQASNFMDYMKTQHTKDDGLFKNSKKLANAMEYAYTNKYSNTKEVKSEARNYKKAIQIITNYYSTIYGESNSGSSKVTNTDEFTKNLKKAMETGASSYDVYSIIESALRKGEKSYSDIQKSLRKISIRQKIATLPDYRKFIDSLSDSDYAVIKTALAYEEHNYPYLDDLLDEINSEATKEYYQGNQYTKSIASILRTMAYNTPKVYNRYNNYNYRKNYNNNRLYVNQYKKQYRQAQSNPMDAYNESLNNIAYGTSKDVWGNETRHYTDGTTYNVRQPGMPFPGGNK